MKINKFNLWIFLTVLLAGCTYTSTGHPINFSLDKKYNLGIRSDGAYRKAYVDYTIKKIYIWIEKNSDQKLIFDTTLQLKASDLDFNVVWDKFYNVTIECFDYGDNVSNYNGTDKTIPKRILSVIKIIHKDNKFLLSENKKQ